MSRNNSNLYQLWKRIQILQSTSIDCTQEPYLTFRIKRYLYFTLTLFQETMLCFLQQFSKPILLNPIISIVRKCPTSSITITLESVSNLLKKLIVSIRVIDYSSCKSVLSATRVYCIHMMTMVRTVHRQLLASAKSLEVQGFYTF